MATFADYIKKCLNDFQVKNLKKEQRECLEKVLSNEDVLAVLPTGYGKSLIYQLLPSVYEEMYRQTHEGINSTNISSISPPKRCCIVVVSPLEYIRKQQVLNRERLGCGIKATSIGESGTTDEKIESGFYNIIYGSAEQWLSHRWKACLQSGSLHEAKVLVVDEIHTVETWQVFNSI